MNKVQTTTTQLAAMEKTTAKLPAVLALVFGVFMVFGAGFANSSAMHNVAHDARHAFSVPCH